MDEAEALRQNTLQGAIQAKRRKMEEDEALRRNRDAGRIQAERQRMDEAEALRQNTLQGAIQAWRRKAEEDEALRRNRALGTDASRKRKADASYSLDVANAEMRNQRLQDRSPVGWYSRLRDARTDYQSGLMSDRAHTQKYGSSLTSLVKDAGAYEQALGKAKTAVDLAAEAHLRFGKVGHDLFRGLTSGIGMIWLSWGQILPMLGGFAASAGVRAMLQVGSQFEHQMKIIQALSQETSGSINGAQKQLLDMSTSSMFSLNDMVGGLKALTQAGFTTQDAMKNLKTVMNLSMLGEVSPDQSALFLAGLRTTFKDDPTIKNGKGEVDLAQASNITAIAAARSQTSIAEMMESMKQASTVADEYHLRLTDVSVGLQLLAERNITGSAAGTSLRNAMEDLTGRTDKARKALALLKVSLYDDKTGAARNPFDVMNDVRSKMENFSESKRKRFLQEFTDERGKKLLEAFLAKSDAEIRQMQAVTFRAGENGGFVTKGADDINTSLQALSGQTMNTFRKTADEVFKEVNPGLKELMQGFKEMAGSNELKTTLSVISQGLLGLAKAVTFTVSAVSQMAPVIAGAGAGFMVWKYALPVVSGLGMGLLRLAGVMYGLVPAASLVPTALAGLINPATLAAAALVAVGGAAAYMWANTETAAEKLAASKSRLEGLSSSLASIRSDTYAKLNQGEGGGQSLGENIDDKLGQRLAKINSSASALQNLTAIQDEFEARSSSQKQMSAEKDIEREMFLMERKRSFLRQQMDEFDQFMRTKGAKEEDYYKERNKFLEAASSAEDSLYEYEMRLSNLRIEQTRKEVEERAAMYLGLGKLMLSASEKKQIETPLDYATNGDSRSDTQALREQVGTLRAGLTAGQDISRDAIVLQAEANSKLKKLDQGIAHIDKLLALNQDNPGAYLEKLKAQKANAVADRRGLDRLLNGTVENTATGTVKVESIANLLQDQKYSNSAQLGVPKYRANGPDKNVSDLDKQRTQHDSGMSTVMSLIDKITGEDGNVTKLKSLLGGLGKEPGKDTEAIRSVFDQLLKQDGAGGDLAKQFGKGGFEGFRKYLLDFVNENMTFEGKLKANYQKLADNLRNEIAAIGDEIPSGSSESFIRMWKYRAAQMKKFDDFWDAKEAEAKGNEVQLEQIRAERAKARPEYTAMAYSGSIRDANDAARADRTNTAKGDDRAYQQLTDNLRERTAEVDRQLAGFGQMVETSVFTLRKLPVGLDNVAEYLKKFQRGDLKGAASDTLEGGKSLVSGFFGTDDATRQLRLNQPVGKLQDQFETKKANIEREANDKYNPSQFETGTAEYETALSSYRQYVDQRVAAAEKARDAEIKFASESFDKQQSYALQTQSVLTKFYTDMSTSAEVYGKTLETGLQNLSKAFIDAAHGANLSFWSIKKGFKDLVKDMMIQMAVNQMMKATGSAISSGLSLLGGLASAYFGGGSAATVSTGSGPYDTGNFGGYLAAQGSGTLTGNDIMFDSAGMLAGHRAAGGRVDAGKPYTVGEQGWEMFVPQADGYVVPNQVARNATKGADSYNVAITINDNSVTQKDSGGAAGGQQQTAADLGNQIKAKVMEVLVEQKRAGGVLSR